MSQECHMTITQTDTIILHCIPNYASMCMIILTSNSLGTSDTLCRDYLWGQMWLVLTIHNKFFIANNLRRIKSLTCAHFNSKPILTFPTKRERDIVEKEKQKTLCLHTLETIAFHPETLPSVATMDACLQAILSFPSKPRLTDIKFKFVIGERYTIFMYHKKGIDLLSTFDVM